MADQLHQFVPVARLLGLSGATTLSAYIASVSIFGVPAVQMAQDTDLMAKQWSKIYNIGKNSAPPLAVACSAVFSFLAWQARGIPGRFEVSPTILYTAAAVVAPSIAPFTLAVMWNGVMALEAKAAGTNNAPSDAETKALVKTWSAQNLVRASIAGAAAVLSAVAMLS